MVDTWLAPCFHKPRPQYVFSGLRDLGYTEMDLRNGAVWAQAPRVTLGSCCWRVTPGYLQSLWDLVYWNLIILEQCPCTLAQCLSSFLVLVPFSTFSVFATTLPVLTLPALPPHSPSSVGTPRGRRKIFSSTLQNTYNIFFPLQEPHLRLWSLRPLVNNLMCVFPSSCQDRGDRMTRMLPHQAPPSLAPISWQTLVALTQQRSHVCICL